MIGTTTARRLRDGLPPPVDVPVTRLDEDRHVLSTEGEGNVIDQIVIQI